MPAILIKLLELPVGPPSSILEAMRTPDLGGKDPDKHEKEKREKDERI